MSDRINDLPPPRVDHLEQQLDAAELTRHGQIAVPLSTLDGLTAILEILHAAHVSTQDGDHGRVISPCFVPARALVKRARA